MPPTFGRRVALSALLVAALSGPFPAGAADPTEADLERARETYRAALALETAGDWAGALGKMREVGDVKLTPQVRFHIARCQEKLGRWVEAVGTYRLAVSEARAAGSSDVAREAGLALAALEPEVPRLLIQRGANTAGATLALDGVPLGETSIGSELPVDAGPHRVEARLGAQHAVLTVTLAARERKVLAVGLPAEEKEPSVPAAPGTPTAGPSRAWPIGSLSVGVVGLATAGTFWALRTSTVHDLEESCINGHCPASLEATSDRGKVFTVVSVTGLAVGVLGMAAFTYFMLRDRHAGRIQAAAEPSFARGASASRAPFVGAF